MRHLVMAAQSGFSMPPHVVAELGPGDSLGTGLAALLSGARRYYAFDVVPYARTETNVGIFDELVELFRRRTAIPDDGVFPRVEPRLISYGFPHHILTAGLLDQALAESRLAAIRRAIIDSQTSAADGEIQIRYFCPWNDASLLQPESVDMIFSQAVLEHVDDPGQTYKALHLWLKPGGLLSQVIDYKSHGTADKWNGHWQYSDWVWRVVRGKQTYLINRQPHSVHLRMMQDAGFDVRYDCPTACSSTIPRERLAKPFRNMPDSDLGICSAFVQASK
jgi:SAM-dependent methyltransferase